MARQTKKVGVNDIDPDLLNTLIKMASSVSVVYDDTTIKSDLERLKKDLDVLEKSGSKDSFDKTKDKITREMLDKDLQDEIDKAAKAVGMDTGGTAGKTKELESSITDIIATHAKDTSDQSIINKRIEDLIDSLTKLLNQQKKQIDDIDKKADKYASTVMIGATPTADGKYGLAPTPHKGESGYVLCGDAKWQSTLSMSVGSAENDIDGNPIKGYVKNVEIKDGKIVLTDGEGNIKSIALDGSGTTIREVLVLTDDNHILKEIYPDTFRTMTEVPNILNTSKVTNMENMFSGCESLEAIPSIVTENAQEGNEMFSGCKALKKIQTLNTINMHHMVGMFNGCASLEEIMNGIDMLALAGDAEHEYANMFQGCAKLTGVKIFNAPKGFSPEKAGLKAGQYTIESTQIS